MINIYLTRNGKALVVVPGTSGVDVFDERHYQLMGTTEDLELIELDVGKVTARIHVREGS